MKWQSEPTRVSAVGKTKRIHRFTNCIEMCRVESVNAITSGDGAKKSQFEGKAVLANATTIHIFEYLRRHGIPVAYLEPDEMTSFLALHCSMIPVEMVARLGVGEKSSYLARHPEVRPHTRFSDPIVEAFLKTTNREWEGQRLPCDDPLLLQLQRDSIDLYAVHPKNEKDVFLQLDTLQLGLSGRRWRQLFKLTGEIAVLLQRGWATLGCRLDDFKIEFGVTSRDTVVLADVIDNDSHRLWHIERNEDISKQGFRDDEPIEKTIEKYRLVADLAAQFPI